MNYYAARQRESDGRYDFTCMNDKRVWPVGYCSAYREWAASDFKFMGEEFALREAAKLNLKYGPLRACFHTDGHPTAAEAQRCYRVFLLDTRLEFSKDYPERLKATQQLRCAECGQWTSECGWLDQMSWPLCFTHQTRRVVEKLFPSVGTITSSY